MYYAVELSCYKAGKVYVELNSPVKDYDEAVDAASVLAEERGLIEDQSDIRCESEVFECAEVK